MLLLLGLARPLTVMMMVMMVMMTMMVMMVMMTMMVMMVMMVMMLMLGRSGSLSVERKMWKNGEKWFSLSVDRPFHIGFVAAQHWTDLAHQKLPQDLKSGQNYVFFNENLLSTVSNDPDRIY